MVFCVEVLGWIVLVTIGSKIVYNIANFFYSIYLAAALGYNLDPRKYGPWAAVTGATDGIGKAYAKKFASLGLNVVLISRTHSKLDEVAKEIRKENRSVQIKTIAVDFTEGQSIYAKLKKELPSLSSIGILVNNVGMGTFPGRFNDVQSEDGVRQMINCNVMSMVRLTNMLLPSMKKKRKGIVINIGSLLGIGSSPLATTYGATKAFVDKFSRDVSAECRKDGVVVQSVLPGGVATKMAGIKGKPSTAAPAPEVFVEANLCTLGIESRTSSYWVHKILLFVGETMFFYMPYQTQKLTMNFLASVKIPSD